MTAEGFECGLFRLTHQIGKGGMATVWAGKHMLNHKPVAVKFLTHRWSVTDAFLRAFRQEIRAMAALDHPNVLSIYEQGITTNKVVEASGGQLPADTPYFAMEYADAGDLKSFKLPLSWRQAVPIIRQILAGLAYSHAQGLIHRDLKPENILLFKTNTDEPRIKLSDFGVAHVIDSERQKDLEDGITGTPNYMAPEQFECEWREFGPWTDIYAIGCMIFRLLTGKHVYREKNLMALAMAHMKGEIPKITTFEPAPAGLQEWLERMLATKISDRFQCAADALHGLDKIDAFPRVKSLQYLQRQSKVHPAFSLDMPPVPKQPKKLAQLRPSTGSGGLSLYEWKTVPIFGREREQAQLWFALHQVSQTAQAQMAILRGMPGHGKSLLAEWLCREAHARGAARFAVSFANSSENVPGQDLIAMLIGFLRTWDLEGKALLKHIQRFFHNRQPQMAQQVADMISGEQLTPLQRFQACEAVIRQIAQVRPMILHLEDVQWSLDGVGLSRYLMRQPDIPVLLVLTVRQDDDRAAASHIIKTFAGAARTHHIDVGALEQNALLALIRYMVNLEEGLAMRVAQCAGGSPLYAVQLLSDWARRDLLVPTEQGVTLKTDQALVIPQSIQQVWQDKVRDMLHGQPKVFERWLEYAAALGEQVDIAEWLALCGKHKGYTPLALLDLLLERKLAKMGQFNWQFIHGMLRESIRTQAQQQGRWQATHLACAEMLSGRDKEALPRGRAARLGYHYDEAGEQSLALAFLLKGAHELRETSDYHAALSLLKRHAEILLSLPEPPPELAESWTLRARIMLHQGRLDEAKTWSERAMKLAGEKGWLEPQCEALRLVGDIHRRSGNLQKAYDLYCDRQKIDADETCLHAAAACFWGLGDIARQWGQIDAARKYLEQSRSYYLEIDDQHGVGDYYIGMGDLQRQVGCWSQAVGFYQQAEQLFEKLGNQYGVARALNSRGDILRIRDQLDQAEPLFRRAATILRTLHSVEAVFPEFNLAMLKLRQESWAEAQDMLEGLLHELERLQWHLILALVNLARAIPLIVRGEKENCERLAGPALATLEEAQVQDPDITWLQETLEHWRKVYA